MTYKLNSSKSLCLGLVSCSLLFWSFLLPVYSDAPKQAPSDNILSSEGLGHSLVGKWEDQMRGGKLFASLQNQHDALQRAAIYAECFGEGDPRLPITLIKLAEVNIILINSNHTTHIPITESPDILINRAGKLLTKQKTKAESDSAYQKTAVALLDQWMGVKSYDQAIADAKKDFERYQKAKEHKK